MTHAYLIFFPFRLIKPGSQITDTEEFERQCPPVPASAVLAVLESLTLAARLALLAPSLSICFIPANPIIRLDSVGKLNG